MSMKKHKNRPHHQRPEHDQKRPATPTGSYWMVGWHAVLAALNNPERTVSRLLVTSSSAAELPRFERNIRPETVEGKEIERVAGSDTVHQGIAALVHPLERDTLEPHLMGNGPLLILDQVTDPHNVGAILRSAAAFGATALILTKDHSAREASVMAKAACGALDIVPMIEVTNLAQAIRDIKDAGFWTLGLDGTGKRTLAESKPTGKLALILGAEGKGMRRLTAESCDELVKLPIDSRMESLNVSNAAAVALYQLYVSRA
ncbi:MAG: 23S rRNA (guanosine(2251)-2'-O)-methyltransferase RlmB [Alphaproteobacteria bacterium]|nr:23S rRNA (guanosine(2251)-2'-O)-methyltransferase RlmB [Alphaproteobacteria bacterium]